MALSMRSSSGAESHCARGRLHRGFARRQSVNLDINRSHIYYCFVVHPENVGRSMSEILKEEEGFNLDDAIR
ncbi:MAG: hypothetical protein WC820_07955, partial [Spirochaetales bacterium]